MNGAILGMTKPEIARKLDEIVDFSGCERYLDTPVKRYSSGMMVRLGFAVAAHLDPEILVVDEVLAVGDAEFQKKAIGKMKDVSQSEGRTVLFVSHNMGAVRNLCKNGIVLKNGLVDYTGNADECVDYYITNNVNTGVVRWNEGDPVNSVRILSNEARIISIGFENDNNIFNTVDDISFILTVKARTDIPNCRINLTIAYADDTPIGTVLNTQFFDIKKDETKDIKLTISNHNLTMGDYYASFSVGIGSFNNGYRDFQILMKTISFKIEKYSSIDGDGYLQWNRGWGALFFPHKMEVLE